MRIVNVAFLFIIWSFNLCAQKYFQQEVSYIIDTEFFPNENKLSAQMKVTYANNSDQSLDTLLFNLYPNAFKNRSTTYAKDNIKRGSRAFYFAKEEDLGGFEELNFEINGQQIELEFLEGKDLAKLPLAQAIAPNEKIQIDVFFQLTIPKRFSRLGRHKGNYHFMHWFPKLAVYDKDGWHPYPYAQLGEFYGEFGDYQVTIKTPKEFKVVASGRGVSASPTSQSTEHNIWVFNTTNTHGFAFVLSSDYRKEQGNYISTDGRSIQFNILRSKEESTTWDSAEELLMESLAFYEAQIGPYPYDQISLVQGDGQGHQNMEYPGLIVVLDTDDKRSLDYYINHELGHMWFYAALGFNERKEPWLDEGLTTFYEHRYTNAKYGQSYYRNLSQRFLNQSGNMDNLHAYICSNRLCRRAQAASTPVSKMSAVNYGIRSYEMAALMYLYLEQYLGRPVFDEAIKSFYSSWKYKHPSTEALQAHFEAATGKDLSWFFNGLLVKEEPLDLKIDDVQSNAQGHLLQVQSNSSFPFPFTISALKDGKLIGQKWVETSAPAVDVQMDFSEADTYVLDKENLLFDVQRQNNQIKTKGLFKKLEPLAVSRIRSTEDGSKTKLFLGTNLLFNTVDGIQLGLGVTNHTAPVKRFNIELFPYYAFESKSIVGQGNMYWDHFASNKIRKFRLGVKAKSFHFRDVLVDAIADEFNLRYQKYEPYVEVHFKHDEIENKRSYLRFRNAFLTEERLIFQSATDVNKVDFDFSIQELSFYNSKWDGLGDRSLKIALEHQNYSTLFNEGKNRYLKTTLELNRGIYFAKSRKVDLRLFASGFLINDQRESSNFNDLITRGSIPLFAQGFNDYWYDGNFINRGGRDVSWEMLERQIGNHGGGFKHALGPSFRLGNSNNFALAINVMTDLPIELPKFLRPIKIYFDAGYYSTKSFSLEELSNEFLYSAGFSYDLKILKIHVPLINSKEINDIYTSQNLGFFQKISFSFDFPRLEIDEMQEFLKI